jgi:murein peptide amidase A
MRIAARARIAVLPTLVCTLAVALQATAAVPTDGTAVVRHRIGTSVDGRGIFAYHLGDPKASIKAVILGEMHGDEPAGVDLARAVVDGPPIRHVDLWVIPTMNPDGLAAHTRQNAHGVDLNRNWSYRWVRQTGTYDSGPHPFSEPESRAMKHFIARFDPNFIVSLHQPLHGVDSDHPKNPRLMNRLAANLNLPKKPFTCGTGVCHGTMTGWFNFHHAGACITVEFGPAPRHAYLTHRAATGTVRAVFGRY